MRKQGIGLENHTGIAMIRREFRDVSPRHDYPPPRRGDETRDHS